MSLPAITAFSSLEIPSVDVSTSVPAAHPILVEPVTPQFGMDSMQQIHEILQLSFPCSLVPAPDELFLELRSYEARTLVAKCESTNAIVGFAQSTVFNAPFAHLQRIAVHPEFRGRWIGAHLLDATRGVVLDGDHCEFLSAEFRSGDRSMAEKVEQFHSEDIAFRGAHIDTELGLLRFLVLQSGKVQASDSLPPESSSLERFSERVNLNSLNSENFESLWPKLKKTLLNRLDENDFSLSRSFAALFSEVPEAHLAVVSARKDGRILGFASAVEISDSLAFIEAVEVQPELRDTDLPLRAIEKMANLLLRKTGIHHFVINSSIKKGDAERLRSGLHTRPHIEHPWIDEITGEQCSSFLWRHEPDQSLITFNALRHFERRR